MCNDKYGDYIGIFWFHYLIGAKVTSVIQNWLGTIKYQFSETRKNMLELVQKEF